MLGRLMSAIACQVSDYLLRIKLAAILHEKLDPGIDTAHVITILMDGLLYQSYHEPISFIQLKRDVLTALGRRACPGAFFYAYQWLRQHNVIQLVSYKQSLCVCLNTHATKASDQARPLVAHLKRFTL